jgi:hypothetical protein
MRQTPQEPDPIPEYHTLFTRLKQAVFVAGRETGMICDANPPAEALM